MTRDKLIQRIRELSQSLEPIPSGLLPRFTRLERVRSVVFDVYGTLFVSGSGDIGIAQASRRSDALLDALKDAGFLGRLDTAAKRGVELLFEEIESVHEERRAAGIEFPEVEIRAVWGRVLSRLHAQGWTTPEPSPLRCERVAVEYECRANPVWPMPGAFDLIEDLRRRGLCPGIVSNAQFYTPLLFPALMGADVEELGFRRDLCVYSYEHGIAKPSPALFRILADRLHRLGPATSETLYVGNDMLNDIAAAAGAGFRTALFAGDARSLRLREDDPRCRDVRPDLVLTEFGQIRDALAG